MFPRLAAKRVPPFRNEFPAFSIASDDQHFCSGPDRTNLTNTPEPWGRTEFPGSRRRHAEKQFVILSTVERQVFP